MNTEELSLEILEDHVRGLAVAESAADVFRALLEGARVSTPRASVFLLRQGQLKGWGAVGYPVEAARRQREYIGPTTAGWLSEVLRSEPPLHVTEAAGKLPGFGQPPPFECAAMSIRVKGRPIAVMAWERLPGELPWRPAVLPLLVRVAQLRLDLDLALRKLAAPVVAKPSAEAPRPAAALAAPPLAHRPADPPSIPRSRAVEPHGEPVEQPPAAVVEIAEAAPPPSTIEPAEAEDPRMAAARRYARLVATDIRLYNEEAVVLGRRDGDLAERLRESLMRGKETFLRRHGDLGPTGMKLLHDAYVDVLAGGESRLLPVSMLA